MLRKPTLFILEIIIFLGIDQLSKWLVFSRLILLPNLYLFRNYNFAFSWSLPIVVMYGCYILLTINLSIYFRTHFRNFTKYQILAWALVIAGGVGNLLDRLRLGYARDFMTVPGGGIINFADAFIVIGLISLIIIGISERQPR